jgi:outer membrane protein assembly factor BamB
VVGALISQEKWPMNLRALGLVCSLLWPGVAAAENWPGWRGPGNAGVSAEKELPMRWSATQNVHWKVALAGAGVSAPVVWENRVFLTASDGRLNDRLHVFCYQADNGQLLWHTPLFGSAQPEGLFGPGGMAVPTPATDGRNVYALFGTGDLVCLDFSGTPAWIRSLAEEYGPFRNRWGMGASPILVGDALIVQVDHWSQSYLLAVDCRTGANRWRTLRDASVNWSSPVAAVIDGKTQIIVAGTYRVKGYDVENGAELWTFRGMEMQCIPSPVVLGDRLFAVSGRDGYCYSIRLDKQRGDVTESNAIWKKKKPKMPYITSPVRYGGQCYLVEDSQGMGICLDAATGAEIWHERLGGAFHASPAAGDDKVYFAGMDGVVAVVKAGPKFQLLARSGIGEGIVASPAISGGKLFIRGEKHLFCIGQGNTGKREVSNPR